MTQQFLSPSPYSRMPERAIDITGLKFGKLTALHFSHYSRRSKFDDRPHSAYWVCECECGNQITTRLHSLRSGRKKSCGCDNQRRLKLSPKAHPLIKFIHEELSHQGMTKRQLSKLSGVDESSLRFAIHGERTNPRVLDLEAMLQVLGYELKPVPRDRQ